jgi:hypothetical protein
MSLVYANSLAILMGFELNVALANLKREKAESLTSATTNGIYSK